MNGAVLSRPQARAARLATFTAFLGLGIAVLFLLIAAMRGLKLGVRPAPAILAVILFSALYWVRRRHERPAGDERVATATGAVMVLFAGGLAGGVICLVGQTFALPFIDPLLHRADLTMGVDIVSLIRAIVLVPGLAHLLAFAYNSSFPILFASAIALAWMRRSDRTWELCAVFNLCLLAATIGSAVIPAVGAFHFLPVPAALQTALPTGSGIYHLRSLFALRQARQFVIDPSQLQGVATFPSFHMGLALMTAAAWRDVARVRGPMLAWQGLVILSTIPIGGHYFVDLVAGALCWALAHSLWQWSLGRNP